MNSFIDVLQLLIWCETLCPMFVILRKSSFNLLKNMRRQRRPIPLPLPCTTYFYYQRLYLYFEGNNKLHNFLLILPENRTADHVFTLRTLIDKYVHYHKEKVYACFVDFHKAFDSVWHERLFYKLLKINIGRHFYNLIKTLYCNSIHVP